MDLCIGSIHCLISWTTEFLSNVCPENYCPKSQEPGLYLQKPYYHQLSRQSNHLAYAKLKGASSHNSSAWKIKGQIFLPSECAKMKESASNIINQAITIFYRFRTVNILIAVWVHIFLQAIKLKGIHIIKVGSCIE